MPRVNAALVAACALVSLTVAGCGSSDPEGGPSASPSGATASSGHASSSARPAAHTPAQQQVRSLQDRTDKAGAGTFTEVTRRVSGQALSTIRGRYSLDQEQLAATLTVPDPASGKVATARVAVVGGDTFLQVDQWKKPSRSCWLRTTSQRLRQQYALDVANSDQVPLPVRLLDAFRADHSQGEGLIDGRVDIAAVLPLLTGSVKQQLVQARPQGTVPAFLTYDAHSLLITVPGYALSTALATALKTDESGFASIAQTRYEAGLRTLSGSFPQVTAPTRGKQMSDADLRANRCG